MNASEFLFNEKIGREEPKGSSLSKTITISRNPDGNTFTISIDGKVSQRNVPADKAVQRACFEAITYDEFGVKPLNDCSELKL